MRVGFYTYPRAGLNLGGLQLQIAETARALRDKGHEVVLINPWEPELESLEVLHVFSFDSSASAYARRARSLGVRVVSSPVLNGFGRGRWSYVLRARASRIPGLWTELSQVRDLLRHSDVVVALNGAERDLLRMCFGRQLDPKIVPNGVRNLETAEDVPLPAGVRSPYVLMVGSIQPRKNQLSVIEALSNSPLGAVIVGGASEEHKAYLDRCIRAAGPDCHFLGAVDPNDPVLAALYKQAAALVLFSTSEVMPLVVGEALALDTPVIVSDRVPIDPALRASVRTIPLGQADQIPPVALDTSWYVSPPKLPSWTDVADRLVTIYSDGRAG